MTARGGAGPQTSPRHQHQHQLHARSLEGLEIEYRTVSQQTTEVNNTVISQMKSERMRAFQCLNIILNQF